MSEVVTFTWAGSPSRIATRAGPWDSPAVSQRSMRSVFHDRTAGDSARSPDEMGPRPGAGDQADQGPDQHRRTERERRAQEAPVAAQHRDQQAGQAEDEEGGI